MSDLPERIWYIAYGDFRETPSDRADDVEYIRKDIADAAVKVERERCAKVAFGFGAVDMLAEHKPFSIAAAIRRGDQP
jgi:hypothetical protein